MGDTTIEWTDKTWNPVTGCTKVSQGCKNCYAERVFPRAYGRKFVRGDGADLSDDDPPTTSIRHRRFTDVQCHPARLDQPLRWKKPARIFVNSMSDLFHEDVPSEFIDQVWAAMCLSPQHTFQVLTKRPERMRDYFSDTDLYERVLYRAEKWRYNNHRLASTGVSNPAKIPARWIHLGVSCEDQETADARIPLLLETPAAVRFVSLEPLLGPIDLGAWLKSPLLDPSRMAISMGVYNQWRHLDWVIAGGESGPKARPCHPDWIRSLRDQCTAASVPFFFKQWGEWAPVCAQYPQTEAEHDDAENASMCGDICLSDDGYQWEENVQPTVAGRPWLMDRIGKKAAGATLDGREWREYPKGGA